MEELSSNRLLEVMILRFYRKQGVDEKDVNVRRPAGRSTPAKLLEEWQIYTDVEKPNELDEIYKAYIFNRAQE